MHLRASTSQYESERGIKTIGDVYVFERRMREEGAPDEALEQAMGRAEAIRGELLEVRA